MAIKMDIIDTTSGTLVQPEPPPPGNEQPAPPPLAPPTPAQQAPAYVYETIVPPPPAPQLPGQTEGQLLEASVIAPPREEPPPPPPPAKPPESSETPVTPVTVKTSASEVTPIRPPVIQKWLDEGKVSGAVTDIKGNLFKLQDLANISDKHLEILRTQGYDATKQIMEAESEQAFQLDEALTTGFLATHTPAELAEVQSGKYQVYDPKTDSWVPTTKAIAESRDQSRFTPEQLRQIESGQFQIYDYKTGKNVAVTKDDVDNREKFYKLSGYTQVEAEETASGLYKIYNYDTKEYVSVPRRIYDNREAFYKQAPGIGPAGTPGKITLEEAQEKANQQRLILSEMKSAGYTVDVIKLRPGEPGPQLPEQYNLMGALQGGFDRRKLAEVFGEEPVASSERMISDLALVNNFPSIKAAVITGNLETANAVKRLYPEEYAALKWKPSEAYYQGGTWNLLDETTGRVIRVLTNDEKVKLIQADPYNANLIVRSPTSTSEDILTLTFKGFSLPYYWTKSVQDAVTKELSALPKSRVSSPIIQAAGQSPFIKALAKSVDMVRAPVGKALSATSQDFTRLYFDPSSPVIRKVVKPVGEFYQGTPEWVAKGLDLAKNKVIDSQQTFSAWVDSLPSGWRIPTGLASMVYDIASSLGAVIPIELLLTTRRLSQGEIAEAAGTIASLAGGLLVWPLGLPMEIAEDPFKGSGRATGAILTMVMGPGSIKNALAKKASRIDPRMVTNDTLTFQIDISRITPEGRTNPLRAVALVEAIELAHLGLHSEVPLFDALGRKLGEVARVGHDVIIRDIEGTIIGHVSAMQRMVPNMLYSVTDYLDSFVTGAKQGKLVVGETGVTPGMAKHGDILWLSQQPAFQFGSKAVIAVRLPKDVWVSPLPDRFAQIKDLRARQAAVVEAVRTGEIPPGLYSVYKGYGPKQTIEYEWIMVKGTELFPTSPKWYAPSKDTGTATMQTIHPVTGEKIPVLYFTTKEAKAQGLGVISLADKYKAEAFQEFVQPWREIGKLRPRPVEVGLGEPTVSSPLYSRFNAVETKAIEANIKQFATSTTNLPPGAALDLVTREKSGARVINEVVGDKSPPIRTLSEVLSEAENIPKQVVPGVIQWARNEKALGYGSINERLRIPEAHVPGDGDFAVRDIPMAEASLRKVYTEAGLVEGMDFKITPSPHPELFGNGFDVSVRTPDGRWETSLNIRDRVHHDAQFEYGLKAQTETIEGIEFETLGTQIARQGASVMHSGVLEDLPIEKQLKRVPRFQLAVEYLLSKSIRTPEEIATLRWDLDNFLRDYASRLEAKLTNDPSIAQAVTDTLTPKLQQMRSSALNKANSRVPTPGLSLGGSPKVRAEALETRLDTDPAFRKAYGEEFRDALVKPLRVTLNRWLTKEPPSGTPEVSEALGDKPLVSKELETAVFGDKRITLEPPSLDKPVLGGDTLTLEAREKATPGVKELAASTEEESPGESVAPKEVITPTEEPYTPPEEPYTPPEVPYVPPEEPYAPPEKPYTPPEKPYEPYEPYEPGKTIYLPEPGKTILLKPRKGRKERVPLEELEGAVTFRQGLTWIVKPKPLETSKVYTTDAPPPSPVYRLDKGLPRETLSELNSGQEPPMGHFVIPWGMFNITYNNGSLDFRYSEKYRGKRKLVETSGVVGTLDFAETAPPVETRDIPVPSIVGVA